MAREENLTGVERHFDDDEILVSKTDLNGKITYVNRAFMKISGYSERDLLGAPHSKVRHPRMPRAVFKLLWDRIQAGQEIFAYVVNRCKNGDEYWVYAHVTPTFQGGEVVGFHSNRRTVNRAALEPIRSLYAKLLAAEQRASSKLDGVAASTRLLEETLKSKGMDYDEFVWSLENQPVGVGR